MYAVGSRQRQIKHIQIVTGIADDLINKYQPIGEEIFMPTAAKVIRVKEFVNWLSCIDCEHYFMRNRVDVSVYVVFAEVYTRPVASF